MLTSAKEVADILEVLELPVDIRGLAFEAFKLSFDLVDKICLIFERKKNKLKRVIQFR